MTDLALCVELIESTILAVTTLKTDERFQDFLTTSGVKLAMQSNELGPRRKQQKLNAKCSDSVVETTVGQNNDDAAITSEMKRLYFSFIDSTLLELDACLCERCKPVYTALTTLSANGNDFLCQKYEAICGAYTRPHH